MRATLLVVYLVGIAPTYVWLEWMSHKYPHPNLAGPRLKALLLWLSITWPATVIPYPFVRAWHRTQDRRQAKRHSDVGRRVTGAGLPPNMVIVNVTEQGFVLGPATRRDRFWLWIGWLNRKLHNAQYAVVDVLWRVRSPANRQAWDEGYEKKGFTE